MILMKYLDRNVSFCLSKDVAASDKLYVANPWIILTTSFDSFDLDRTVSVLKRTLMWGTVLKENATIC